MYAEAFSPPLSETLSFFILEGSPEERGRTLARVLGDELGRARALFGSLVGNFARQAIPVLPKGIGRQIDRVLYHLVGRKLASRFSPDTLRMFRAMQAERPELGTLADLLRSHVSLDLLSMTSALSGRLGGHFPSVAACSCLAALGSATASGHVLVGRNFDLPAYRPDAPPSWIALERPKGGIPHVSFYHAPGYIPGITAINREGLIVGVLMNFSQNTSRAGVPIVALARSVIENAQTLDDARRILRRNLSAVGWTFFVVETKRRRALCFEVSPKGVGEVEPEDGMLFAANRFRSKVLKGTDAEPNGPFREHNDAREARFAALARAERGRLTPQRLLSILGDSTDPSTGRRRAIGPCIATAHNIGSVAFAPEDDTLFVACGAWPANAAGSYAELDLSALFSGELVVRRAYPPNWEEAPRRAISAYLAAVHRMLVEGDGAAAEEALDQAIQDDTEEPVYRVARGALRLRRAFVMGAEADLRVALRTETWPCRRAYAALLLGYALDLGGLREEAREQYRSITDPSVDPQIAREAEKRLRRPFARWETRFLGFDPVMAAMA